MGLLLTNRLAAYRKKKRLWCIPECDTNHPLYKERNHIQVYVQSLRVPDSSVSISIHCTNHCFYLYFLQHLQIDPRAYQMLDK